MSGCATSTPANVCTGQVIYLTGATIDRLTDEEAKAILTNNEQLTAAGCK